MTGDTMLLIQKQDHYNITEQRAQAFFAILSRQAHFIEGTGDFTTRESDLLFRRERLATKKASNVANL
ncbi:MAG: hypothetical protein LIO55_07865 [Oscillospiraceae bacterium]|nr:hypothetical protein [Oscillospiraceae bacterium]